MGGVPPTVGTDASHHARPTSYPAPADRIVIIPMGTDANPNPAHPADPVGPTVLDWRRYQALTAWRGAAWLRIGDVDAHASVSPVRTALPASGETLEAVLVGDQPGPGGAPRPSGLLYVVSFVLPASQWRALDTWYAEEHVALLLRVPGWLRCTRFRVDALGWVLSLALHDLASLDPLSAPERGEAMATSWRARLAQQDWFATKASGLYALSPPSSDLERGHSDSAGPLL
jgi:hypothetical protein